MPDYVLWCVSNVDKLYITIYLTNIGPLLGRIILCVQYMKNISCGLSMVRRSRSQMTILEFILIFTKAIVLYWQQLPWKKSSNNWAGYWWIPNYFLVGLEIGLSPPSHSFKTILKVIIFLDWKAVKLGLWFSCEGSGCNKNLDAMHTKFDRLRCLVII